MDPKREPKWSPKASQDGTKKEKKSEVKLRELSEALGAKKRNERRSDLSSYKAAGGGRGDQDRSKSAQVRPKSCEIIERCRKKRRTQTLQPQVRRPRTKQSSAAQPATKDQKTSRQKTTLLS